MARRCGSLQPSLQSIAAAAYRFGEKLHDERYDLTHDYTRRQGVLDTFIVAPEDAPQWVYPARRVRLPQVSPRT